MASKYPDLFAGLAAPFDPSEVKSRPGDRGRTLSYITARTAANRLDAVLGPESWEDEFYEVCGVLFCRITVTLPDGSRVSKCDAGGFKEMTTRDKGEVVKDQENTDKTGASDAFKRAASKFGVARYLYHDGIPDFRSREPGEDDAPPGTHTPASPPRAEPQPSRPTNGNGHGNGHGDDRRGDFKDRPPTTGRALFAWIKNREAEHDIALLKHVNGWAKLNEFPGRMIDWDEQVVKLAHAEATRKLNGSGA